MTKEQMMLALGPLKAGDKLERREFIARWDQMPDLKRAELIDGVVYMPSPLSRSHAHSEGLVGTILGLYALSTQGCESGHQATWYMLKDAPQPDAFLRILAEYGGQSKVVDDFYYGAPELAVEVCVSSTSYDMNQKKELYLRAGVQEFLAVLVKEKVVRWHRLEEGAFVLIAPDAQGLARSRVFPGLWLNHAALLAGDGTALLTTLEQGLKSDEHRAFVAELARRKGAR